MGNNSSDNRGISTVGVIILLVVIVIGGYFIFKALKGSGGLSSALDHENTTASPEVSVETANSFDKLKEDIGKNSVLTETTIRSILSDKIYLVGNETKTLPIVIGPSVSVPADIHLQIGTSLALSGIIREMPAANTISSEWKLNSNVAESLSKNNPIYIEVKAISKPKETIMPTMMQKMMPTITP